MSSDKGGRTSDPVLRWRLSSQLLSGRPAATPLEVVTRLLAVQAQDPRGARLSVRSRSLGQTAADVDAAHTAGSLLVTWLNRGTLHLVTPADYWWLHPLTTPQLVTGNIRRLRQEGVSMAQAETGVEVVADAVSTEGPQTRGELRARLDRAGVPTKGQAFVHILMAASIRGLVVRGPVVGGETAYVSVPRWLGPPPRALERGEALGRLTHRFLRGHGPATAADLGKWAGITLGDARQGFSAIAGELATVRAGREGGRGGAGRGGAGGDGLMRLADQEAAPPLPPPRLLGPFDPLLLGWVSRQSVVGEHRDLVTTNGIFRPFGLVDGRAVATWGLTRGTVEIRPLERIAAGDMDRLRDDAVDVLSFLGLPARPATVTDAAVEGGR